MQGFSKWRKPSRHNRSISNRRGTRALHRRPLRLEPLENRRLLATVTVTTPQDTINFNDGLTSLREAIFVANTVAGHDTIEFDFGHDGPATISLQQGELRITDDLTIRGAGAELLTIDASASDPTPELHNHDGSRIFNIDGSGQLEVSIAGLTLTGGDVLGLGGAILNRENLTLTDSIITGNAANDGSNGGGGGIHNSSGELTIENCTIRDNYTPSSGGGVQSYMGRLTITHSIITDNRARQGAGIDLNRDEATVSSSIIRGNRGAFGGGGIDIDRGNVVVRSSWIHGNEVGGWGPGRGGGIWNHNGSLTVIDTTISGNTATKGAGIHSTSSGPVVTVRNSTISGNVSAGGGGGIYNAAGRVVIELSTITGNSGPDGWGSGVATAGTSTNFRSAMTEVYSSIIAGNTNSDVDFTNGFSNTFVSRGYNLIGTGNALDAFRQQGDLRNIADPRLAPLADNGGRLLPDGSRIPTHGLWQGSHAINAGDPSAQAGQEGVPFYDQRGEPFGRVLNGPIDIGAFELSTPSDLDLVVDTLVDEMDDDFSPGDLSLREAIAISNLVPTSGTIRFSPALFGGTMRLTMGELRIIDDVSIVGPGDNLLTIDASASDSTPDVQDGMGSRIFYIETGRNPQWLEVSISGLRLTGGDPRAGGGAIEASANLQLRDVLIERNATTGSGGALSILGSAVIEHSTFIENRAGGSGGAIFSRGDTTITNCIVSNNAALAGGGGIAIERADLVTIRESTIAGNSAGGAGGGILSSRGETSSISDCMITGNIATHGAGLVSSDDRATIARCTIADNRASHDGGGIRWSGRTALEVLQTTVADNEAGDNGGGILHFDGELILDQCTLSGNKAGTSGGGMHNTGVLRVMNSTISGNAANHNGGGAYLAFTASATIAHSTIVANQADADAQGGGIGGGLFIVQGVLALDHSIVAENLGTREFGRDLTGFLSSSIEPRFSLIGTNAGTGLQPAPVNAPDANGNMIGPAPTPINPQFAPLADNGGPTKTHALLAISPAINRGDPASQPGMEGVPAGDQRGALFTRVFGGRIDIGAFESQSSRRRAIRELADSRLRGLAMLDRAFEMLGQLWHDSPSPELTTRRIVPP